VKAIVLGAGGHIGNAIVRKLCQRDWHVTAATRNGHTTRSLNGLPVVLAAGEFSTPAQADALIESHDLVIDAAAPYALHNPRQHVENQSGDPYWRLEQLLNASHRGGARFAYISSFATLIRQRSMLDNARRALLEEAHPYFALKARLEAQVLARRGSTLRAVVVNPTACLGPWDPKPLPLCFLPLLLNGFAPASSNHPINIIDVRDLAALTIEAVEQHVYYTPIALCGHNMTVDSLASLACRIERLSPPQRQLPAELAALSAYTNERLAEAGISPLPYPSLGMLLLLEQRWVEPSATQRELGVKLTPASRTIVDAIDWYKERGLVGDDVTGVDVVAPLLGMAR
jgi:dihydroflavonol-4-reductase